MLTLASPSGICAVGEDFQESASNERSDDFGFKLPNTLAPKARFRMGKQSNHGYVPIRLSPPLYLREGDICDKFILSLDQLSYLETIPLSSNLQIMKFVPIIEHRILNSHSPCTLPTIPNSSSHRSTHTQTRAKAKEYVQVLCTTTRTGQ